MNAYIPDLPITEPIYLYLQLNTSSPDPIGFAHVSGFYGPGAWAGWFLTLCASWYNIFVHGGGFDANTCLYLIALNAAAIDHLLHLHTLSNLRLASDPSWMQEAASVGAAFTITWWGFCGVLAQLASLPWLYSSVSVGVMQRLLTLLAGSIIPAASIAVVAFKVNGEIGACIPALYWRGMLMKSDGRKDRWVVHDDGYYNTSFLGLWGLLCCSLVLFCISLGWVRTHHPGVLQKIGKFVADLWNAWRPLRRKIKMEYLLAALAITFILSFFISFGAVIVNKIRDRETPTWVSIPFIMPWLALMGVAFLLTPIVVILLYVPLAIQYIVVAYLHQGSTPSQSCFFMPCAPYSITELDQAVGLFLGMFSFFIIEVVIPYTRRKRDERIERLLFEQEVGERIELGQIAARPLDEQTRTGLPNFGRENAAGPQAEASAVEVRSPGPSRVNSGIAVEEGRAGSQRVR